ncbi:DUF6082 family protein [Actinomadura barringtoniae]|uniref:DUF6082 family protein n=1 Tax=Actinomadura barringtoniae TaxID=1427535 RepID=UPI003555CDC2
MRSFLLKWSIDWRLLSDVGQTYGAIAAVLSAGALVALGFSLFFQTRELRQSREQAARTTHAELMKMVLDEPVYRECIGAGDMTDIELRQGIFLNLLLNWWQMRWVFGDIYESEVHELARNEIFGAEPGRRYWELHGMTRIDRADGSRARRFNEIFDEEYAAAVASGPLRARPDSSAAALPGGSLRWSASLLGAVGLGAGLAVVGGRLINRTSGVRSRGRRS